MLNLEKRKGVAKYLYDVMNTVWDEYDFTETSVLYERRVPNIQFNANVKIMLNEVQRLVDMSNRYVREVQIEYENNVYIFTITTWLDEENKPMRYSLNIFIPSGDGKGGTIKVYEEKSL